MIIRLRLQNVRSWKSALVDVACVDLWPQPPITGVVHGVDIRRACREMCCMEDDIQIAHPLYHGINSVEKGKLIGQDWTIRFQPQGR